LSPGRVKNFLFSKSSRPALRSTQPPIQWVPGALSPGVKWPRREVDHSPPTSAEVKKIWIYTSTPIRLHGVVLNYLSTGTTLPLPLYSLWLCEMLSLVSNQRTYSLMINTEAYNNLIELFSHSILRQTFTWSFIWPSSCKALSETKFNSSLGVPET
jgi:hypothetical protein